MSNFKFNVMNDNLNNFFKRPVGAAVLFLNDFHHGKRLNDLNRCARLVPEDVKGFASLLSNTTYLSEEAKDAVIDTLISFADTAEQLERFEP